MSASAIDPTTATGRDLGGKYLTFILAGEEYGFPILSVHEIIGMLPVTPVPHSHACIRGVVNLRGKVIPIVDLRRRFAMPESAEPETCIIVLAVKGLLVGVAVDAVSEVRMIAAAAIEPPPAFGADVDVSCLLGVSNADAKVRMLLDADRVLALDAIATATAPAP